MFQGLHTVAQGTVGTAIAIAELSKLGFTICVPLVDAQAFDLVIADPEGELLKVQVKTTSYKKRDNFLVQLKRVHHNRTQNIIRKFDSSKVDIVVVVCADETVYIIPSREIHVGGELTLDKRFDDWRVQRGSVAERLKAFVLKTNVRESAPSVRI